MSLLVLLTSWTHFLDKKKTTTQLLTYRIKYHIIYTNFTN